MRKQRMYYVYILARPNGTPFYVGCSGNLDARLYAHEREAARGCPCPKCVVIRDIWRRSGVVQQSIVYTSENVDTAFAAEVEWTEAIGWNRVTNQVAGGRGSMRRSPALTARIHDIRRERSERRRTACAHVVEGWNRRAEHIYRTALQNTERAVQLGYALRLTDASALLQVCDTVVKGLIAEGRIVGSRHAHYWTIDPASVHAYLLSIGHVPGYAPMHTNE